ncbi:MAG: dual specificity protein phosphatase family protein [Vicinamibacteria bacterium]|nr:dual specificity protein phosphatase family protein [Vicinamibacteria bacterium]
MGFDRITETLYLGSRIASLDDYHRLRAHGVRACVDMKQEGADPWAFETFLWLPTVDHTPPTRVHLHMAISFLRHCEREKVPAYVHCMAGVGRSAAAALAYLLAGSHREQGADEAILFMRTKRPQVHPSREQVEAAIAAADSYRG